MAFADGGTAMHFDDGWYETSSRLAKGCLRQHFRAGGEASPAIFELAAAARASGTGLPQEDRVSGGAARRPVLG